MEPTYKILSPTEYEGSPYGDYGYEIDGVKSKKGYISRKAAEKALYRQLDKQEKK